jgi:hypothetical protein
LIAPGRIKGRHKRLLGIRQAALPVGLGSNFGAPAPFNHLSL